MIARKPNLITTPIWGRGGIYPNQAYHDKKILLNAPDQSFFRNNRTIFKD
jgi:hypothetical protein